MAYRERRLAWALLAAASVTLAVPPAARAVPYEFTVVADTARLPRYEVFSGASVSNAGTVSFVGSRLSGPDSGQALIAFRGGALVTLADTTDGVHLRIWSNASFNDRDEAAFAAEVTGVGEAIVIHDGASARRIYPSPSAPFNYLREPPALNNAGHVAFRSIPPGSPSVSGAYTGDGLTTRTVAERSQPFGGVGRPDLNNAGQVAFREVGDPTTAIYVDTNGTRTLIATAGSAPFRGGLDDPMINDGGRVAFVGYDGFEPNDLTGVYAGSGGAVTTVADSSGPLGRFGPYVGINNGGRVAFVAWLDGGGIDTGGSGIYTGPDLLRDRVIAEGDALDGSVVNRVYFYGGINDSGQIAFEYGLADGRGGIALATPVPEPSAALVAVGLLWASGRRRKKR